METARTCALGMLVSFVACSSSDGASVREKAPPPPPPAPTPIALWYDDAKLSVALPDGADRVPLYRLVGGKFADRNLWQEVKATGGTNKLTAIRPSETYKEHTFRLFRGKDGKVSLGLFRDLENVPSALQPRLKEPVMQVVDVEEIFIRTTVAEAKETFSPIVLSSGKKPPITLDREVMSKVPRHGDRKAGWKILDVVTLIVPSKNIDHLMLHTTDGRTLRVDGELLATATVKLNKKGIWKFKPPEDEDFSPLDRIEVVSKTRKPR